MAGEPRSIKKLRSGDLLVEYTDKKQIENLQPESASVSTCLPQHLRGWSGGAIVLGKLPVPGRPTIWITVGQGPTVLAVGAGGVVWTFLLSSILSFLFLPLFGDGPI